MDASEDGRLSAAALAYRALERMIVTLELSPSSVTTEGGLIERTGVGRTPVREAIQRLAWEGLLEIRPRAGIAIAPLNPVDWRKVIDARRGVEVVLARAAARNAATASAEAFHDAAMTMQRATVAGNVLAFLEADKSLDEAMAAAADNPFAARLAAPLQVHSRRFWYRFNSDSGLMEASDHHVGVIRAILDHDEDKAARETKRLMGLLAGRADLVARR